MPGAEDGHYGGDEESGGHGHGERFVEGEDAMQHGGCCYEHGEVVTWFMLEDLVMRGKGRGRTPLCVVLECGVEDGGADSYACNAEIGEISQDRIFVICV